MRAALLRTGQCTVPTRKRGSNSDAGASWLIPKMISENDLQKILRPDQNRFHMYWSSLTPQERTRILEIFSTRYARSRRLFAVFQGLQQAYGSLSIHVRNSPGQNLKSPPAAHPESSHALQVCRLHVHGHAVLPECNNCVFTTNKKWTIVCFSLHQLVIPMDAINPAGRKSCFNFG